MTSMDITEVEMYLEETNQAEMSAVKIPKWR